MEFTQLFESSVISYDSKTGISLDTQATEFESSVISYDSKTEFGIINQNDNSLRVV